MSERSEKMDLEREEQTSKTLTFWDLIGMVNDTNHNNQQMTKDTSSTSQKRPVILVYKVRSHKTSKKDQQKKNKL